MNDPRLDYLARNRDHIERVCIECVQQAVNEQAPDPIARVGELLLQQASNASAGPQSSASRIAELEKALTTATTQLATATTELAAANARIAELEAGKGPVSTDAKRGSMPPSEPNGSQRRPSLNDQVKEWRDAQPLLPARQDSKAMHAKFAAAGETFTFTYGDVDMFFGGLEGLLGTPSPEVMPTMTIEHASEEPFNAWNSDVERTTTPKAEWAYVTEGTAGTADVRGKDTSGHVRRPSRAMDGLEGKRTGWKLENFAQQPEIKKAGLLLAEVAGVRSYTCAASHSAFVPSPHPPKRPRAPPTAPASHSAFLSPRPPPKAPSTTHSPLAPPQGPNVRALQPHAAQPRQGRLRHHAARHQQRDHQALQADQGVHRLPRRGGRRSARAILDAQRRRRDGGHRARLCTPVRMLELRSSTGWRMCRSRV